MHFIFEKMQLAKLIILFSILLAAVGHFIYFVAFNKYLMLIGRMISGCCMGAKLVNYVYIVKFTNDKCFGGHFQNFGLVFAPLINVSPKLNFKLLNLFEVSYKTAPGLIMTILWSLCFFLTLIFFEDESASLFQTTRNTAKKETTEIVEEESAVVQVEKLSLKDKLKEFLHLETVVLLIITFFIHFNQTAIETIAIPFVEIMFGWSAHIYLVFLCLS
jgi:hypothetical protein